jgi:hypothetical protein
MTRRVVTSTPALEQFLGAYLHQDWRMEAPDVWTVVDLFMRDEPVLAADLPAEIARVLTDLPTEPDLKKLVIDELGGYYLADADGGTYRSWLQEIADRVRAASGDT